MLSLSSRIDARMTTARRSEPSKRLVMRDPRLVDAAETRGVRPGREAARVRCPDGGPDLLERAPVIRRPFVPQQPAAVGGLEAEIHLQPAPVRAGRIRPAALVVVDAHPG